MIDSTLHSVGPKFHLLKLIPKLCEQTLIEFKGRRCRRTQLQRSSFVSTFWVDESPRCAGLAWLCPQQNQPPFDRWVGLQAALLCVALSILAGAAVLIVEFVHKMEQVALFALLAC